MKNSRSTIGAKGEEVAARYLMARGHTILARNWRSGHLELDIVSLASDGIHFVEVKSRTAPVQAEPEENVTFRKQKNLTAAAARYLSQEGMGEMECRFDIISIIFDGGKTETRYLPEAFIPIYA